MIARITCYDSTTRSSFPCQRPRSRTATHPPPDFLRPRSLARSPYRVQPPSLHEGPRIVVQPPPETVDLHDHEDFCPINRGKSLRDHENSYLCFKFRLLKAKLANTIVAVERQRPRLHADALARAAPWKRKRAAKRCATWSVTPRRRGFPRPPARYMRVRAVGPPLRRAGRQLIRWSQRERRVSYLSW
jgi:hypothetical protein